MDKNKLVLSKRKKECLIAVDRLHTDQFPAKLVDISKDLKITSPTTLAFIKKLEDLDLLKRKEGMVVLTEQGVKEVMKITMCHRVVETLLYKNGMSIEKACKEASKIDKLIPDSLVRELFKYLGRPKKCPHGFSIPEAD